MSGNRTSSDCPPRQSSADNMGWPDGLDGLAQIRGCRLMAADFDGCYHCFGHDAGIHRKNMIVRYVS